MPCLHNFGAVANCDRVRMYFTDYLVDQDLANGARQDEREIRDS